ncbi:hypothetical protein H5T87_10725 [bacterium]|nr:hypothetical protein [bacterium]
MKSRKTGRLFIPFILIVVLIIVVFYSVRKGKKAEQRGPSTTVQQEALLEKKEIPLEKLEEIWKKELKIVGGGRQTADYPKEMGNREAKVKVDAFFPPTATMGEGLKISTDTLQELVRKYKDKLYVRIYLIVGPIADETQLDCAAIFINGKNYIKVDGEEIILLKKNTHNPELLRKAIEQAIKENYGDSTS